MRVCGLSNYWYCGSDMLIIILLLLRLTFHLINWLQIIHVLVYTLFWVSSIINWGSLYKIKSTCMIYVFSFELDSYLERFMKWTGKRNEQEKSDNVAVDWENKFANAHVKGSSWDNMEAGIAKLQGQHGRMQLKPFGDGAPHSGRRGWGWGWVSHWRKIVKKELLLSNQRIES